MKLKKVILGLLAMLFCSTARAAMSDWYPGGSYDGYDSAAGSASFAELCINNANGATNVTISSAWLNGMLVATSAGEAAMVSVYWGTVDCGNAWGSWANMRSLGSIPQGQFLSTSVSVNPDTTYYYNFYATNATGEGWPVAATMFSTPASPVLDTGIGAIPVGARTATLHGSLTAGLTADVSVYWGLTDGGTNPENWGNTNSLGLCYQGSLFALVSGLDPATSYVYRYCGTNIYGQGWSDASTFTTIYDVSGFAGGGYDGYDRMDVQTPIQPRDPNADHILLISTF